MRIQTNAWGSPTSGFHGLGHGPSESGPAFAVRLIDRRTGRPHRINGQTLTLYTRAPQEAVAELMHSRDPALWDVRVDPLVTRDTAPRDSLRDHGREAGRDGGRGRLR
jgi:hypothetical protein